MISFDVPFRPGRDVERRERAEWITRDWEGSTFEGPVRVSRRHGRIDALLTLDDGSRVVIEIKATDWDATREFDQENDSARDE